MAYQLAAAIEDPAGAARHLRESRRVWGVAAARGHTGSLGSAVLELTLEPLPALEKADYPIEAVRLVLLPDARTALAYPRSGEDREFAHRNVTGDLCLQYRRDDPALRWLPEDGLEPLVTLVQKHLWFEERWRRTGVWPCEDAPHGDKLAAHPIRTDRMHQERGRWTRQSPTQDRRLPRR